MKKIITLLICFLLGTLTLQAQKGIRPRKGGKAASAGRVESKAGRAVEREAHRAPKAREVPPKAPSAARGAERPHASSHPSASSTTPHASHTQPPLSTPHSTTPSATFESAKHLQTDAKSTIPDLVSNKESIRPLEPLAKPREEHLVAGAEAATPRPGAAGAEPRVSGQPLTDEARLAQLEREQQALLTEQEGLLFDRDFGKSVLYAPLLATEELGYTVTVVKVGEEVFGVLPSHALPDANYANLSKQFYVRMTDASGNVHRLPAEVVQISPESMLDISLVKFAAQDEALLRPLQLADAPAQLGEELYSFGYAAGKPTLITRSVNSQAFLSLRTNQAIEGAREGFCGSPLLNANGEVVAIHTGTVEYKGDKADVSFGTHASFIQKLVDAYHNNGTALYDLALDGHTIARLNVDEYVSAYRVFDANGKLLVQKNIEGKYSESQLRQAMQQHPQGKYLHITTRKAQWKFDPVSSNRLSEQTLDMLDNPTQVEVLHENRTRSDKTKVQHWYNIETQQIEPQRPSVIKN